VDSEGTCPTSSLVRGGSSGDCSSRVSSLWSRLDFNPESRGLSLFGDDGWNWTCLGWRGLSWMAASLCDMRREGSESVEDEDGDEDEDDGGRSMVGR
jgi:hypothetical protein